MAHMRCAKYGTGMLVRRGERENISLAYVVTRRCALAYPWPLGLGTFPAAEGAWAGGRAHVVGEGWVCVRSLLCHRAAFGASVPTWAVEEAVLAGGSCPAAAARAPACLLCSPASASAAITASSPSALLLAVCISLCVGHVVVRGLGCGRCWDCGYRG
jgi:hypothetical protein